MLLPFSSVTQMFASGPSTSGPGFAFGVGNANSCIMPSLLITAMLFAVTSLPHTFPNLSIVIASARPVGLALIVATFARFRGRS